MNTGLKPTVYTTIISLTLECSYRLHYSSHLYLQNRTLSVLAYQSGKEVIVDVTLQTEVIINMI